MRVRHTPRARRDLEAIYDYLDRNNPDAARAVKLAVSRATELLADFPKIGVETDRSHGLLRIVDESGDDYLYPKTILPLDRLAAVCQESGIGRRLG